MDPELLAAAAYPRGCERPGRRRRAWPAATRSPRPRPCARRGVAPALAAAALTQADLRRAGARRSSAPDAGAMFFTRAGLEQATRAVVADRRAARLARRGRRAPSPTWAAGWAPTRWPRPAQGIRVYAVDADPVTAALAAANVAAAGLADLVTVDCADATTVDGGAASTRSSPIRPGGGRAGGRVFDPKSYSPPWDFIAGLADRVPRTVLKLAPGIDHALLPPGAEGEWVSVDGDLVEAAFWCGPLAEVPAPGDPAARRPDAHELTGDGRRAGRRSARSARYLYDPDPAVVRSHLVAEFAAAIGGRLADPEIAYVYTDDPVDTPFAPAAGGHRRAAVLAEAAADPAARAGRGAAGDPQARLRAGARAAAPDLRLSGTERGVAGADPGGRRADASCCRSCGGVASLRMAKKAAGTPATVLLTAREGGAHPAPVRGRRRTRRTTARWSPQALGRARRSGSSRPWSPRWTARWWSPSCR